MADEQIVTDTEKEVVVQPTVNPFDESAWATDAPPVAEAKEEVVAKTDTEIVATTEEVKAEAPEWVKDYGWESPEQGKAELEELRQLKAKPTAEEIKFANEQSKQLHQLIAEGKTKEVREFLERKEKLEAYTTAEVSASTAPEIIKLGMQLKYKDLTPSEIEYKFKKQFGIPKEPSQSVDETDEEFEARKSEWQEQVSDIETSMVIEAKLMKPELEQSNVQLVLPEISKKEQPQTSAEPTQEELEADRKFKEAFLKAAETSIANFSGFSTSVKDKDVDIPLSYGLSTEEKVFVSKQVNDFAESGFNANAILAHRWVNDDKTVNVDQMVKDLSRIYASEKIDQKLVNDAAAKRMELYLKEKKQINVNETEQKGTFHVGNVQQEQNQMAEFFWNQG
jgi:hypothetical protein